jgi:hypothetical protein
MANQEDPFRADAALVYRALRDAGPGSVIDLVDRCFPVEMFGPESSYRALLRRALMRVYDSVVWMRHQGVVITAVPGSFDYERTQFHLGPVPVEVSRVHRTLSAGALIADTPIGARLLEDSESQSEMDVWHGK